MRKDVIKSLIAIKQSEIPFDVIERDVKLPTDRKKIITIPGVRRCGKSTLMEIAINNLVKDGVARERILWLGFDDERLRNMAEENTREREIKGLLEASVVTGCNNLFIITKDEELIITQEDKRINIVPAWKWLLQNS